MSKADKARAACGSSPVTADDELCAECRDVLGNPRSAPRQCHRNSWPHDVRVGSRYMGARGSDRPASLASRRAVVRRRPGASRRLHRHRAGACVRAVPALRARDRSGGLEQQEGMDHCGVAPRRTFGAGRFVVHGPGGPGVELLTKADGGSASASMHRKVPRSGRTLRPRKSAPHCRRWLRTEVGAKREECPAWRGTKAT
jgi:hypothetical protein